MCVSDALTLIEEYATIMTEVVHDDKTSGKWSAQQIMLMSSTARMSDKIVDDARSGRCGTNKIMRLLGFMQGQLAVIGVYTVEQIAKHNEDRKVFE